jgi:hypothetical protein
VTIDSKQIAEAFSTHQFATAYPYLSDQIEWNMIGGEVIRGKEAVIETCDQSSMYLSTVKTTFNKFKTFVGENSVVIDSLAAYIDEKNNKSVVASCDIYEFQNGMLQAITSYTVEIAQTS